MVESSSNASSWRSSGTESKIYWLTLESVAMAEYYPFDPNTRQPSEPAPSGACDCQFHVFGPSEKYPPSKSAAYKMPSATIDAALKMHRTLGIERGVIVQSTVYGTNHSALLDGLAAAGPSYKGCAVINDSVSDRELEALRAAGVVAARFNFLRSLNLMPTRATFERTAARAAELGWILKMQPSAEGVAEHASWFEDTDVPVIIDHIGRVRFDQAGQDPNMQTLLRLLDRGNFWVMLSNAHKWSKQGYPWDDAVPVLRTLAEKAPERMIWATDWPHPVSTSPVPNDADILDLFYRCFPEPGIRKQILVDNPARLFGFDG